MNTRMKYLPLGFLPTRKADNEYRRVGYAVWADCSWYGYDCGEYSNSKPQGLASGLRNNTEIAMKNLELTAFSHTSVTISDLHCFSVVKESIGILCAASLCRTTELTTKV